MKGDKFKLVLIIGLFVLAFGLLAPKAQAATFFLSPGSGQVAIGQTFDVTVRINSVDQGFNAAQATIQFSPGVVQVKSIDSSPASSAFNFWLTGPTFSNTDGRISFVGGTTNGVVGASIEVLRITFVAKASGVALIIASDAAVTASDGSGTNILTTVSNANFSISQNVINPAASTSTIPSSTPAPAATPTPSPAQPGTPPPVVAPQPIVRQPTMAAQAPVAPKLNIQLYPDPTKWYNQISDFLVQWPLPSDISGISAVVDKNAKTNPPSQSEGLYDAKAFKPLSDGIWYVHVKLQNNIGWGSVAHYKISVDTVPPLPFTVNVAEGLTTDSPRPTLQFATNDGLSGIDHYIIRVDNGDEIISANGTTTLPIQTPGKKTIVIKAFDKAGNDRESTLNLEILPIAAPTISAVGKDVFANETDLTLSGTALPNIEVWLSLKNANGSLVTKMKTAVDAQGNWGSQLKGPFKKGTYFVEVVAQDGRGATSWPVKSDTFKIKDRPILTIGGLGLSQSFFFFLLFIIMLGAFGAGWWTYSLWRKQLARKAVIAQRDVINVFTNIEKDLNILTKISAGQGAIGANSAKIRFTLKSMKNNLAKAQRYIIENIKEIGE